MCACLCPGGFLSNVPGSGWLTQNPGVGSIGKRAKQRSPSFCGTGIALGTLTNSPLRNGGAPKSRVKKATESISNVAHVENGLPLFAIKTSCKSCQSQRSSHFLIRTIWGRLAQVVSRSWKSRQGHDQQPKQIQALRG